MWKRILSVGIFLGILGGALAGSKKSDSEILTKVGRTLSRKIVQNLPEKQAIAGPIAAVNLSTLAPVETKIRRRLDSDQLLQNNQIKIHFQDDVVTLSGIVLSPAQRDRAVFLAETTTGVKKVVSELAIPVK